MSCLGKVFCRTFMDALTYHNSKWHGMAAAQKHTSLLTTIITNVIAILSLGDDSLVACVKGINRYISILKFKKKKKTSTRG